MNSSPHPKPKIVIYGIGQYGQHIARFALQKGWTIVAAYNRAGAKVGQDLGRVAGLDYDLGVIIEDCDTAQYDNIDADIGIVPMTNYLDQNMDAYRRLLGAGLNVLCHGTESYFPHGNNVALANEIDALAKQHGVSFTGSGIWDMSRIWAGILVAGPCTDLNHLFHSSITDVVGQAASVKAMEAIGIGLSINEFMARGLDKSPVAVSYKTIPEHVLAALGYNITATRAYVEPVTFKEDLESVFMQRIVPAGEVVGSRVIGEIDTQEGVTARAEIELRLFKEGEVEHMFWEVDGLPRTRIRTERDDSAHATAACLFNRIPDVIAAPPGIALLSQLGPLKSTANV